MIKREILEKTFLGSLLLFLYRTDNITRGNIEKYWKKLHKDEHTLQEIIDYIENDKKTKLDLSNLALVSHKLGAYAPLFTVYVVYNGEKIVFPVNGYSYEDILEHLGEEGILVHFFERNEAGVVYATSR